MCSWDGAIVQHMPLVREPVLNVAEELIPKAILALAASSPPMCNAATHNSCEGAISLLE